ncbi:MULTISPECIES: pentapeptide repeat-containing protein [unclassified Prochlorococcus]|uniref:pentapeptide repeat-containing protein n=1 Tax=unclassified Prochlorococcus TaxID=2627481 RepID=UPI000533787D|nr:MULTISPECIES: pentapeptide repeat-containing protein [unclassified Prochlorococcus]KGG15125.1 putative thylakoid membrane protein [Prochlorococcus sp. MIT 0602]KGG17397.1 putative thylakoid membrane protein [Prochlorococcus sp. MIT 0603]
MLSRILFFFISLFLFLITEIPGFAAIDYGKQTLVGNDFSKLDLKGATFYLTNLQNADLSDSDLEGANLFGAKLLNTNLSNTNLKNATLDSAVFDGANLENAVLEDAFAFNARFNNVEINGSDFTNVILRDEDLRYLCSIAIGVNPVTQRDTKETLECI